MKIHIHRVHEGRKDYKCDSCGKSFSALVELEQHIHTVHEGHRDYKCEDCGNYFAAPCSLNRHIKVVHANSKACQTIKVFA